MGNSIIRSCIMCMLYMCVHVSLRAQSRITLNIDEDWKFAFGNITGAELPGFNDDDWSVISLPHTWNNLDGQDGNSNFKKGTGWYRKDMIIPADYQGKRVFIRFGAANLDATVYINGNQIDVHHGGYSAFVVDITSALTYNHSNVIAVKVNNANLNGIAPISADFTFCGGLTRSVDLIVTNPIVITLKDYASPGFYLTQERVTDAAAEINVRVLINNYTTSSRSVTKIINIKDAGNQLIQTNSELVNLPANTLKDGSRTFLINNPTLWNGRFNPYLYKVEVILKDNNLILDSLSQPLGLRYYEVSPDSGFYLNGKRYPLYGVNMHEDRLNKGRAILNSDRTQDIEILNELGVNFIRLSHYPHDELIYDLADKYGIVLWSEIPLINRINNTSLFIQNIKDQLKEMIRQNYNHPSVFFWGLFNEILQDKEGPDPLSLITDLNTMAHAEDDTRLTTVATNTDNKAVNEVADLVSFNKYYGWYSGQPELLDNWILNLKDDPLSIPAGLSEYGAGASILHHELYPSMPNIRNDWHPEEHQNLVHEHYWKSITQNPFLWQSSVWVAFDFSSDSRNEGDKFGINDKGLVTQDRKTKKDAFYFYKSHWNAAPVVYITSRRYSERTVPETYIKVYSNCDSVRLMINNVAFKWQKGDNNIFVWDNLTLNPGVNIIKAIGRKSAASYNDSCVWRYDVIKAEKTIRINFQSTTTQTPSGYLADSGLTYGPRNGGFSYGWHVDNTANARERNLWQDKLYDSFNHFQKSTPANYWDIALDNGTYLVQIVSGDPLSFESYHKILAEGKVVIDGTANSSQPWIVNERIVALNDGKLTIDVAPEAINAKINFVHITRTDSTNLALGKKVTQSSILYKGNPEKAIDGNSDGLWKNGSIISTAADLYAWWEIDLGEIYNVTTIDLWNRIDACCKSRLSNYYIFVSDIPFASTDPLQVKNQSSVKSIFSNGYPDPVSTYAINRTARYIRIQSAGTVELNIAEVVVMGALKVQEQEELTNVALNKPVMQSSTRYEGVPERAVDGNTDGLWSNGSVTHTYSNLNAWWQVDLGQIFDISTVEIWNRTNICCMSRLSNYYLFASDDPFESAELNPTLNQSGIWYVFKSNYPNPSEVLTINRTARYIRIQIQGTAELNLAEVFVNGTSIPNQPEVINLAYHKSATQSSTLYGGVPGRAVDGNTDGSWSNGSVTHTKLDANAWWEVDLGDVYNINTIALWNRTNSCCMARLSDFNVFASSEPFESKDLNTTLNQSGIWHIFQNNYPDPADTFIVNRAARYVRVQSAGTIQLNIAEVIVLGTEVMGFKSTAVIQRDEPLDVNIYPVPFNDLIHIQCDQMIKSIEIFNVLGESLILKEFENPEVELNTDRLSHGFYLIRVKTITGKAKTIAAIKQEK